MTQSECEGQTRFASPVIRGLLIALAAFAALGLSACSTTTDDSSLTMVDPQEALKTMHDRSGVLGLGKSKSVWVDPRSLEAYRKAHIPGAIHLPFSEVADEHELRLEGVTTIVVYGEDYNDVKAKGMSKRLIELGYDDVRTLAGGLRQWESQGHDVETGDPSTATASQ